MNRMMGLERIPPWLEDAPGAVAVSNESPDVFMADVGQPNGFENLNGVVPMDIAALDGVEEELLAELRAAAASEDYLAGAGEDVSNQSSAESVEGGLESPGDPGNLYDLIESLSDNDNSDNSEISAEEGNGSSNEFEDEASRNSTAYSGSGFGFEDGGREMELGAEIMNELLSLMDDVIELVDEIIVSLTPPVVVPEYQGTYNVTVNLDDYFH